MGTMHTIRTRKNILRRQQSLRLCREGIPNPKRLKAKAAGMKILRETSLHRITKKNQQLNARQISRNARQGKRMK